MSREDEKQKLWDEVMNKKRDYDLHMTKDEIEEARKAASSTSNAMLDELQKQINELSARSETIGSQIDQVTDSVNQTTGLNNLDVDKLAQDLNKDYGVEIPKKPFVAEDALKTLNDNILGESEGLKSLLDGFRRPLASETDPDMPKNVIIVSGPKGTGRHTAIETIVKQLNECGLIQTAGIQDMDLSAYVASSNEQIFLQDLYEAVSSKDEVIVFENFANTFAPFVRMIASLAESGTCALSKRYVLKQGVLVESQALVAGAVDSFSAAGKYLIFITEGKPEKLTDVFGAGFLKNVRDIVTFKAFDDEVLGELIAREMTALKDKCSRSLNRQVTFSDDLADWIRVNRDKNEGMHAVQTLMKQFYSALSDFALDNSGTTDITVSVENDQPVATCGEKAVTLIKKSTSDEEIAAIMAELDEIVGLKDVKEYMKQLEMNEKMKIIREKKGLKTTNVSRHMIFTGNPGTGKTTIARLFSRYMKAIGGLSQGQLVEVTRADLVAKYVGQTAPLTMSVINSALGGVLFIDEAYALYQGEQDSFGSEAIDTLVKAMEDHRDDLIVILAGYKKEMEEFLTANSGLKSRFPNIISFADYTGEELVKITELQARSKGYKLSDAAKEHLLVFYDGVQQDYAREAGNGRLARNKVEAAILRQNSRLAASMDENADLETLGERDFEYIYQE